MGEKSRKQGDQGEAGAIIQMRCDSGSGLVSSCEVSKKWLGTGCISKVLTGLADGFRL